MASLLSKDHFEVTNGDKILTLNKLALAKQKTGEKVINATVGMLFDENKNLSTCAFLEDMTSSLTDGNLRKYGSVNGGYAFKNSLNAWLFENIDLKDVYIETIATNGATGALSLSMRNYCNKEQEILVPSIRWSNYDTIASQVGCRIKEYNLFNSDDKLDIEAIKHAIDYSLNKYQRAYLLINDPCQNPTGYTMSLDEWEELLKYLNDKASSYPIVLLDDIAYLNYSDNSYEPVFELFKKYLTNQLMINIAFSASKTLSIYGYRGGGLIALSNQKKNIEEFTLAIESTVRATYSMPNNLTCHIINEAFKTFEKRQKIKEEISINREMLKKRANLFFEEANMVNLVSYPYVGGFFVLIPCEDEEEVCQRLIKKNIFVVPMSGGIRISLSSLTLDEVKGLAKNIKKALK